MPKPPPQTIGVNPLDQLVPYAATAAIAGRSGRQRPAARPDTTVLTVTVPSDLADRLEQIIAVMPGLDLDSLASEALELVWAKLRKGAAPGRRDQLAASTAPGGRGKAVRTTGTKRTGRDADAHARKVVVILGE